MSKTKSPLKVLQNVSKLLSIVLSHLDFLSESWLVFKELSSPEELSVLIMAPVLDLHYECCTDPACTFPSGCGRPFHENNSNKPF